MVLGIKTSVGWASQKDGAAINARYRAAISSISVACPGDHSISYGEVDFAAGTPPGAVFYQCVRPALLPREQLGFMRPISSGATAVHGYRTQDLRKRKGGPMGAAPLQLLRSITRRAAA
jgi:hypothetical protein